jgi:hypothetical protein
MFAANRRVFLRMSRALARTLFLVCISAAAGVAWLCCHSLSNEQCAGISTGSNSADRDVTTRESGVAPGCPLVGAPGDHTDRSEVPEAGIIATYTFQMSQPLQELARQWSEHRPSSPPVVALPLRPNRQEVFQVRKFRRISAHEGVLEGVLMNDPESTVVISYVNEATAGTVYVPREGRSFVYRAGDHGSVRVLELDLPSAPACGDAPQTPLLPPI